MSTYGRDTDVTPSDAPPGYTVFYCEIRGYDSPARWYEVRKNGRQLKGLDNFGKLDAAIKAMHKHAQTHDNEQDRPVSD